MWAGNRLILPDSMVGSKVEGADRCITPNAEYRDRSGNIPGIPETYLVRSRQVVRMHQYTVQRLMFLLTCSPVSAFQPAAIITGEHS